MANEHIVICSEIIIDSTNDIIEFKEAGIARTATLDHGIYFLYGNGAETGTADEGTAKGDLTANITAAMNTESVSAAYVGEVYFWSDSTHIGTEFVLNSSVGTVQLLATSTFPLLYLGFSGDTSIADLISSDVSAAASWMCDQPYVSVLNITRDHSYSQRFSSGGKPYSYSLKDSSVNIEFLFNNVSKRRTIYSDAETNITDSFESFYDTIRKGCYIRLYVVSVVGVAYSTNVSMLRTQGVLNLDKTENFNPKFVGNNSGLYDFGITVQEVVAL